MPGPLIDAVGLCKHYASAQAAVRAVSDLALSIDAGEFAAIVGRSGSGKSTTMHLLGLLERPDSGRYSLGGRDVSGLGEDERAAVRSREIGFVFQLPSLLPRASALENVELPLAYAAVARSERRRRARDALESVGLGDRLGHWPHQLSGGEQQRVAIARAVVNDPALILADEPTGALDSKTSGEILALLDGLHRSGRTIVVVTHASDVAEHALRRIVLHDGRIVEDTGRRARAQPPVRLAAARGPP